MYTRHRYAHVRLRGFTIVELLVVVAIIVLLVSILLPSMRDARAVTKLAVCSAHQKQLAVSWFNYSSDNNLALIAADNFPAHAWTRPGNTMASLTDGKLWPYLNDEGVYKCPTDPREHYLRSYSINHFLGGEPNSWGIHPVQSYNRISRAADTLLFIDEDDPRGYNINSWVIRPHGATDAWVDWPGGWHTVGGRRGGDPLSYADLHVETYWFQDPDTMLAIDWFFEPAPNSPDLEWFRDRYNPGDF